MLCLVFFSAVFVLHVYKGRSIEYRRKPIIDKINICYQNIVSAAPVCCLVRSPHYVLQNLAILHPTHPSALLWIVHETPGFNIVLGALFTHKYIALALALTTPLSFMEGIIFVALFQSHLY